MVKVGMSLDMKRLIENISCSTKNFEINLAVINIEGLVDERTTDAK